MPGLIHHGDIDAGLLQRFDITQRQEQFFTRITRRIEIKTPGVNQFRHLQQIVGFPVGQGVTVLPLADKRRQRFRLHAVEVHIHVIDVQRHHRQAFDDFSWQERTAAGKAHGRFNIAGGDRFFVIDAKRRFVQCLKVALHGDDQVAIRLKMAQTQLFQIWGQFPGTVHFAALFIDDVNRAGEILIGIERNGKSQHQG